MTDNKTSNQQPASDDLSSDSEVHMRDLSEDELNKTHGGDGSTDKFLEAASAAFPPLKPFVNFVEDHPGVPQDTAGMQANH